MDIKSFFHKYVVKEAKKSYKKLLREMQLIVCMRGTSDNIKTDKSHGSVAYFNGFSPLSCGELCILLLRFSFKA